MSEIKLLLDDRIREELEALGRLSEQDKEKSVKSIVALHGLLIDEERVEIEAEDKRERREMEDRYRTREQDGKDLDRENADAITQETRKNKIVEWCIQVGIAAANLILPLIFYGKWMNAGFRFEETGTITSSTFKNLIGKFKPTK